MCGPSKSDIKLLVQVGACDLNLNGGEEKEDADAMWARCEELETQRRARAGGEGGRAPGPTVHRSTLVSARSR